MAPMFPSRQERLDWQLIAELEPVVLVAGSPEEIEKLQDVLAGLAFCSLEVEFGRETLEGTRGLAKIFRLSQLVIQYLIHCQDQQSLKVEKSEEREQELSEELTKVRDENQALEGELKAFRKELKKRKKMLTMQQESMIKDRDFREFRKCCLCPKVFVNESFLFSHMKRRHKEMAMSQLPQSQDFVQTNREELKELIGEIKNNFPKTKTEDYSFLAELVRTQQDQINQLHTMFRERPERTERREMESNMEKEEGKLKAQEILWQSKVKALEESFAKSLLESEKKLQALQSEFENEKQKLKKGRRRDRRKRRKADIVERDVQPEFDGNDTRSEGNNPIINPVSDKLPKSLAKVEINEVETNYDTDNTSQASQEQQSELDGIKTENKVTDDETNGQIRKAISSVSLKSEHMYEAPLSFRSSKENILELIEKNPSKIDQYRTQVKTLLSDQLEQLGVDSQATKMSDDDYSLHLKQIKDYRRRLSQSDIGILRAQYKEEVDALASQSSLKHGSLKKRLSQGMSSFRKQIFRSLQNLNTTKQQPNPSLVVNMKKKKSPKKKLAPPPPPPSLFKSLSSTESSLQKPENNCNVYVESPVRLPPKPAPRASKVTKVVQRCLTPSSTSCSEDEFEEHIDIGEHENIQINTIEVHRKEDSEDEDTVDGVENLSENKSLTDNESEEEGKEDINRTANDSDLDEEDTAADDKTFSWDSEDNDNIDEIENVDLASEKKTEIKLTRPRPGSKIADLTNIIESQLHRRAVRPAGGVDFTVDPLVAAMERCEEEAGTDQDLSTNTLATSQWMDNGSHHTSRPCSAQTFPSVSSRPASALLGPPQQPQHRRQHLPTSWDSD